MNPQRNIRSYGRVVIGYDMMTGRPATRKLIARTFCIVTGLMACAGHTGGPAGGNTADRESEAEYDLARDSWLRRGDARDGLIHALRSIEIDDDNADAHHIAALILLDLCLKSSQDCRLADGEAHARKALRLRVNFREARNTLGVVLLHEKKFNEAVSVLEPLTKDILYTTPESAWGNLGWAYLEIGRVDDAQQALQRSVAAQPRFCVGYYRLGLVQERKGLPEAAIESFTNALQADSRCAGLQDALLHRAKDNLSLGRSEPARSDLSHCAELSLNTLAGKECRFILQKLK